MVDNYIGNGSDTIVLKCLDHGTQLVFCSETGVVVEIVIGFIAHYLYGFSTFSALRNPYEVDESFELCCLSLKSFPLCSLVCIPREALQHDSIVVCRPSLCRSTDYC